MKKFIIPSVLVILLLGITVYAATTQTKETAVFNLGEAQCVMTCTTDVVTPPPPIPDPEPLPECTDFCLHENITATVFWIGEPKGNGSSEDNAVSAYDGDWVNSYGGYDDYECRNGWHPCDFTPKENPFYVTVPYEDIALKNRWVRVEKDGIVAYAQIEDSGPYVYNDYRYVYQCYPKPKNRRANRAGMDVSPALRDYLQFEGLNNADNKVDWEFVEFDCVEDGPWKDIITYSEYNW